MWSQCLFRGRPAGRRRRSDTFTQEVSIFEVKQPLAAPPHPAPSPPFTQSIIDLMIDTCDITVSLHSGSAPTAASLPSCTQVVYKVSMSSTAIDDVNPSSTGSVMTSYSGQNRPNKRVTMVTSQSRSLSLVSDQLLSHNIT